MKKALLSVVLLLVLFPPSAALRAQDEYHFMRPDKETYRKWMKENVSLPETYIDPALQPKRGSFSLLRYLPYNPAERLQGSSCGNCWVWAATGCVEIAHRVQSGVSDRLSIQYLNSCKTDEYPCCGGTLPEFCRWYADRYFFVPWRNTNAAYGDVSKDCGDLPSVDCEAIDSSDHHLINTISASVIPTYGVGQTTAIARIKNVLHQNKAVYFTFCLPNQQSCDRFMQFWQEDECENESWPFDFAAEGGVPWNDAEAGVHSVLIVGYQDYYSSAPFEGSYWIAVNSWGNKATDMYPCFDPNFCCDRPDGCFRVAMETDYDAYFDYPDPENVMMLFQTVDVDFGSGPTLDSDIRVYPDRESFSASDDMMYIYADIDPISIMFYPFVRIVTPYYGTYYLTLGGTMYPYPMPYIPIPLTSGGLSNYLVGSIRWTNIGSGTYYLEGGGVNAAKPVMASGAFNYISSVSRTACRLK